MQNPFQQVAPTDVIARVHNFARDLAYGATLGLWHTRIQWKQILNPEISQISQVFASNLRLKWGTDFPSEFLLLSFGYFQDYSKDGGQSSYLLTQKAFELLEKPFESPSVFISYRRQDSSAFALLVEARLRLVGNSNPYVDKNLIPGEEWNLQLNQKISGSSYFVVLIGPTTLTSPHVLQEIQWASESASKIISIWHNGVTMDDHVPVVLQKRHAIVVTQETTLGYEIAVNQLLNAMGYATY